MTYDPDADAAYIYISDPIEPGGSASSSVLDRFTPGSSLVADFDVNDKLLGIELLVPRQPTFARSERRLGG